MYLYRKMIARLKLNEMRSLIKKRILITGVILKRAAEEVCGETF
jgi:hypothetical protein